MTGRPEQRRVVVFAGLMVRADGISLPNGRTLYAVRAKGLISLSALRSECWRAGV